MTLAIGEGERVKGSLTPETREGLERSLKALEDIAGAANEKAIEHDADGGDDALVPGQSQL